jgi:hypothetical protein
VTREIGGRDGGLRPLTFVLPRSRELKIAGSMPDAGWMLILRGFRTPWRPGHAVDQTRVPSEQLHRLPSDVHGLTAPKHPHFHWHAIDPKGDTMKPSLLALTIMAMLVATAPASSLLLAAPVRPSAGTPSNCAPLLRLPRAARAGQSTLYGHIRSLRRTAGRYEMRFDPAQWLTGVTASRAALEDTGSSDVPNDYYLVDESHRLFTYVVPASAHVTIVTGLPGRGPCTTAVSVARLVRVVRAGTGFGFWIRVGAKYPSLVLSLDQQYQP